MYQILLCDDEEDILYALKIYLRNSDYRFFEAHTGKEALEVMRNEEIDLVLMDIMMPEMDGITALEEIRKFSNVPVLFLTAKGEEMDKIIENYSTKRAARDGKKKTPIVQNGVLVEKQERNYARAMRHIVAEAIVDPNLKSPEAMEFFECYDMSDIIYKAFPTPDEYNHVVNNVLEILGLSNDTDDEDDVKAAKN